MTDVSPVHSGRRELRRLERRQAIVAAARVSFLEHGYAGTSMSGLLATLGGSKATLWSYFRSKEELFAAVVEDVTAQFRADLADALSPAEALEPALFAFCRRFILTLEMPESIATWRLVVAESGRFPEIGTIFYESVVSVTESSLATFLAPFAADGTLRGGQEPIAMARMLLNLCTGRQHRMLWGIGQVDGSGDADARRFVDWFLRVFAAASPDKERP